MFGAEISQCPMPSDEIKQPKRENPTSTERRLLLRSGLGGLFFTIREAKLFRKGNGKPAELAHLGHALAENRNGLIMDVTVTEANGRGETEAAIEMVDRYFEQYCHHPATMGSDKGYDNGSYYIVLESRGIVPHGAMTSVEPKPKPKTASRKRRPNALARCRMKERQQTQEYQVSQRSRKKIEECFGWMKCVAGIGRSRHIGRWKIKQQIQMAAAAFNLVRLRKLLPTSPTPMKSSPRLFMRNNIELIGPGLHSSARPDSPRRHFTN